MAEINSGLPITTGCHNPVNRIAFDGCNYFCTMLCKCEIIKLNEYSTIIQTFYTCRVYNCICYDCCEHCFWASSKGCYNKLFKLNCEMQEIDCIEIQRVGQLIEITGISYKCCTDTLIVSFPCCIYEVEKCCGKANVLYAPKQGLILGVLSLCPGMIVIILRNSCYYMECFDPCNNKTNSYAMKGGLCPRDIIFNPCKCEQNFLYFDLFIRNKFRYPYLFSYRICCHELGFSPCPCNYKICDQCCCDTKEACADVIESIALMETALSHILNAEGEKIQKVLETTDDIDKILCVNREVNKTIVNATHLEHVLHAKLSTLCDWEICEDPCKNLCMSKKVSFKKTN